ncbi:MAG: hypothetical protein K2I22_08030 [Lachnospiraceae bacterium]|nr:hypothetical protein [Lachnospiraceae bacterium]
MPAKKTAAKEAATEVKVTPVKAEKAVAEEKAAPAKAEAKAAPAKAEKVAKTTKTTKTAKAAPAKRGRKPGSKTELKVSMNVQFGGKSYTTDDLVKIAKDVWKYDLKQKAADFKSVELYVKPEDGMAYYVINGKEAGSFYI